MKRIIVVGCGGAGKSTFSKRLSSILNLELIHLDQYYWKPNWVETSKEEWTNIVENLCKKDQWIMDGNFGGTMDLRIQRADTLIFMDYSTLSCLWRITKRTFNYYKRSRPDMTPGCNERIDLQFYWYVATHNRKKRKKLLDKLNRYQSEKSIHILRNDREVNAFIEGIASSNSTKNE